MAGSSFIKHWFPLVILLGIGVLSGCSDNNSSSSNIISVQVQVGQEDINEALVRRVVITEDGELNSLSQGVLVFDGYLTDDQGQARTSINSTELNYFDVYGREGSSGVEQTTRRCQLVAGCGEYAFGDDMPIVGSPGWTSLAYALSDNETIKLTALTTIAEKLAYGLVFSESAGDQQDAGWLTTGYYSDFAAVQSVSQVSKMFGIMNVQTTQPADLTELDEWGNANSTEALDSIRYGAILAAWQSFESAYSSTDGAEFFADAVGADLVSNSAQLYQKGGDQTLALYDLYILAADNLEAVDVENSTVQGYVATVVASLRSEAESFSNDALTTLTPAPLADLIDANDLEDYELGLDRTKAFVEYLRDYENNFFEEGYKEQIDTYTEQLQSIGDQHADSLDTLVQAYVETFEFYRSCYINGACPAPDSTWRWFDNYSYDNTTGVLTLNDEAIRVSQEIADINFTDSDNEPTSSQGIDVLITGIYFDDVDTPSLRLEIDHVYAEEGNTSSDIETNSAIRVFYSEAVSDVQDPLVSPEIAYRLRWSSFTLYDLNALGTVDETEVQGSFAISYLGVEDPDGNDDLRFNIESAALSGRISDHVDDDSNDDENVTTFAILATSTNADDFYPEKEFTSFNGFFNPMASDTYVDGYVAEGLVSYRTGSTTLDNTEVLYFDYFIEGSDSFRYRFYPTVMREDSSDSDNDGNTEEEIATFDFEQCEIIGTPEDFSVGECDPKQRLLGERSVQFAVNELWETGVFSRPEVAGQGSYFVEFPVNSADSDGCLSLADLPDTLTTVDGTLYRPAVLGLDSARFTTEVTLEYDPDQTEPQSLLDIVLTAPAMDELEVSAALSHDYSASSSATGVFLGSGSNLDRLIVNYSRAEDTLETGSIAVYKDGVSLTLSDGSEDEVDSELLAGGTLETATGTALSKYIIDEDGFYDLCIVTNAAEAEVNRNTDDAVWVLNFRDVVYGKIQQENGIWLIRYIDGTWESLQ